MHTSQPHARSCQVDDGKCERLAIVGRAQEVSCRLGRRTRGVRVCNACARGETPTRTTRLACYLCPADVCICARLSTTHTCVRVAMCVCVVSARLVVVCCPMCVWPRCRCLCASSMEIIVCRALGRVVSIPPPCTAEPLRSGRVRNRYVCGEPQESGRVHVYALARSLAGPHHPSHSYLVDPASSYMLV